MTITTATTAAEDTTSDASRIANVEQFAYRMRHNVIDMGEEQGQGYVGQALGAAGDFHAGGVRGHCRHREAGVVGAVGFQFAAVDDSGLGECGVVADGVVAGGEKEPVPTLPCGIVCAVTQLVGVDGGEDVGGSERLPDVSLTLFLTHV